MSELQKNGVDPELEKLYSEVEREHAKETRKTKPERQMDAILNGMDGGGNERSSSKDGNELLRFFGGLLLFGAGMYMIFQNLIITSSWGVGSIFRVGNINIPNGTIMIPLLIGIALLFLLDRKLWGWLFIGVGIVIVIAAILMSVSIQWRTSNGWMFFTMFAMTFAGGAMMMRELFRSK